MTIAAAADSPATRPATAPSPVRSATEAAEGTAEATTTAVAVGRRKEEVVGYSGLQPAPDYVVEGGRAMLLAGQTKYEARMKVGIDSR